VQDELIVFMGLGGGWITAAVGFSGKLIDVPVHGC